MRRALLGAARLEPTTSLDAETSQRVLTPLRRLITGRTAIVIPHNQLTVADANQILYPEAGHVTETSTRAQLVANNNHYAHLYRLHYPPTLTRTAAHTGLNAASASKSYASAVDR